MILSKSLSLSLSRRVCFSGLSHHPSPYDAIARPSVYWDVRVELTARTAASRGGPPERRAAGTAREVQAAATA